MTYYQQWHAWKKYATRKTIASALILSAVLYILLRH